jgi:hypothetical protein
MRVTIKERSVEDFQLDSFKIASYPIVKFNTEEEEWRWLNFNDKRAFSADIQDFYRFANYTNTKEA